MLCQNTKALCLSIKILYTSYYKMGLSETAAQKIIKGVQNERLAEGLHSAKALGELSLQKLLDMKESGVEIENFTSADYRLRLFEQEVKTTTTHCHWQLSTGELLN